MKRKIIIPFIILLLTIAGLAIAGTYSGWFKSNSSAAYDLPDAKEEFRRLYEHYRQRDTALHLQGAITLYDAENKNAVKEKSSFRLIRQGDQFYSQFSYLQTFNNGHMLVQLDTVNHIIIVAGNESGEKNNAIASQAPFDVLFNDTASFKISGSVSQANANERTLSFKSDFNPEVRAYRIIYNPFTYQVKQADIEWWKDGVVTDTTSRNRVWISRIVYQHLPATDLQVDNMINKIITIKDDQIETASDYKDYQLHVSNPQQ